MEIFPGFNLKNPHRFRRYFRTWIGILFLLSIPLFVIFQYRTWTHSLPKTEGELVFSTLQDDVHIFRDGYSIPHIFAKNEYDLFFAQGFVTAQDRLWQMDILRRTAKGQLSEIFGVKSLATDSLMRFIGIHRFTLEWKSSLSETSKTMLQAYADGVNASRNRMPIEAKFLNYKIAPWTIEDCLAVYLLFALQSDVRWMAEPFFMAMSKSQKEKASLDSFLKLLARSMEQPFLGILPSGIACAVTGSKTETGKPMLLAFLPVPQISMPSSWYEIYLSSPQIHVRGFSIPGFPFVWSGFNGKVAWIGMPSGEKDLHISILPTENHNEWTRKTEWIKVKGQGKYLFDFSLNAGKPVFIAPSKKNSTGVQVDWSAFSYADLPLGFYHLMQTDTPVRFHKAIAQIPSPPTIWIYADTLGKVFGRFFQKGKFQSFLPKDVLMVTDFQMGDLNSRIITAKELSSSFRMQRVLDLCQEKKNLDGVELKTIATDQTSPLAIRFLRLALPQIASEIFEHTLAQKTFGLLSQWKGDMNPGSAQALFTEFWMHTLIQELFCNSMEEPVSLLFSKIPLLPYQFLMQWLEDPPVDSATAKAILLQSFTKTLEEIKAQWGENPFSWNWASAHTLTFHHPLDGYSLLKRILDAGPFPMPGASHTLSGWVHEFQFPFRISSGHGARMLIDLSNPDHSVSILSTGQSGQALDVHYRDQLPLFLQNCYHPSLWDSAKITQSGWNKLILKPKDSL